MDVQSWTFDVYLLPAALTMAPKAQTDRPLVVPVFLPHAGCPHRCVFCNQRAISGADRLPSAARIRKGIASFLAVSRPRSAVEIAFFGGTFLGLPEETVRRLLELAGAFVEGDRADGIRFSTRPDSVDARRMAMIRPYPVRTVELGVQSLDDRVLAVCRRGHEAFHVERAVLQLKEQGYRIGLQLMVGLPGQNLASWVDTAARAAGLGPDFVRIYPTLVLSQSPLARWYRQKRYTPLTLEDAVYWTAAAYRHFSENEIPVVRMGLQPTEELLSAKEVLAGPFHPAFGEQVRSAVVYGKVKETIAEIDGRNKVNIFVHPKRESQLRGPQNRNLTRLRHRFALGDIEAKKDAGLDPDILRIEAGGCLKLVRLFQGPSDLKSCTTLNPER